MPESVAEALLQEREGYVARGLPGRVAEVDAALAAFGVAVAVAVDIDDEAPFMVVGVDGYAVDLNQLDKDDLMALAASTGVDVGRRPSVKNLREALIAAASEVADVEVDA